MASIALGQLCGVLLAPRLVKRFGYRITSLTALSWISLCVIVTSLSSAVQARLPMYLTGELLLGIAWGSFQATTLPYISDIAPYKLKGPITTMINIYWLLGQALALGSLRASWEILDGRPPKSEGSDNRTIWAVRTPMVTQYLWLIFVFIIFLLAPESPHYLSRSGYDDEAKATLCRLNRDPNYNAPAALATMKAVDSLEQEISHTGNVGILPCFRGTNLRRTEIAVIANLTQLLVAAPLLSYGTMLLRDCEIPSNTALIISLCSLMVSIIMTVISVVLTNLYGRRRIWIAGIATEIACLAAIGAVGFAESAHSTELPDLKYVLAGLFMVLAAIFHLAIAPVSFTIIAEAPSTRLKTDTNSIARSACVMMSLCFLFLAPKILEPAPVGWGWGAKGVFIWVGTALFCLVWSIFRLPEMKNRSPEQIDLLFGMKIPARQWTATTI